MVASMENNAWALDQLAKSAFFHQKLHEWGVIEIAYAIERIKGELLDWDLDALGISQDAWDKIIHRGIKPVIVFAHPEVLTDMPRAVAYYRTLSMVSQKSMTRIGINSARFEQRDILPSADSALLIAQSLNDIISRLVEATERIDAREFDIWRGMAAGSQAQGSWQNAKGKRVETEVKRLIQNRLAEKGLVEQQSPGGLQIQLTDGRRVVFSDEPDIGILDGSTILAAIEVKGGIDAAGVLERVGAAMKSLSRAKEDNPDSATILVLQEVSLTETAQIDLHNNREIVNHWFTLEQLHGDAPEREEFWRLIGM